MTDDLKLFLEMANDWTAVPVVRDAPERAADVVKQCVARLLAAEARAEQLRRLAKEATNGWACYAKRKIEHDDITRLHREIDTVSETPTPPSP